MKTIMKIAVIAMMGMGFGVKAQNEAINGNLTVKGSLSSQGSSHTFSTESGKTNFRLTFNMLDAENAYLYNYNHTAQTFHTINVGGSHSLASGLTILGNGNVGIGTASPSAKLDVNGEVKTNNGRLVLRDNSIEEWKTNGNAQIAVNYLGYNKGTSQFRDFSVYNGKSGRIILVKGSTRNVAISGKLEAKEIKVTTSPTADFVFEEDYNLPTLKSIEKHIKEKKHLPDIASAKEMEKTGVNVGDFQIQLLQKIEELTLYTIAQEREIQELKKGNSKIDKQQKEINAQKKEIDELKALVQKLLKEKN